MYQLIICSKNKNKVEHKNNGNKFEEYSHNAGTKVKEEEEIEVNNNNNEEAENKIIKANDKVNKINELGNEHLPKAQHENNEWNEERVEKIIESWIQPTKCVSINYFFKKIKVK